MSGHLCADCQRCPACGRSAWCEGDRLLVIPCSHHGYCSDCNLEHCLPCRREAFAEMCKDGGYDPEADPFYVPSAHDGETWAEALARQADYIERRKADSGFNPVTNSYEKRSAS